MIKIDVTVNEQEHSIWVVVRVYLFNKWLIKTHSTVLDK